MWHHMFSDYLYFSISMLHCFLWLVFSQYLPVTSLKLAELFIVHRWEKSHLWILGLSRLDHCGRDHGRSSIWSQSSVCSFFSLPNQWWHIEQRIYLHIDHSTCYTASYRTYWRSADMHENHSVRPVSQTSLELLTGMFTCCCPFKSLHLHKAFVVF